MPSLTPEDANKRIQAKYGERSYLEHDQEEDRWKVYRVDAMGMPQCMGEGQALEDALAMAQVDPSAPESVQVSQPAPEPASAAITGPDPEVEFFDSIAELTLQELLADQGTGALERSDQEEVVREEAVGLALRACAVALAMTRERQRALRALRILEALAPGQERSP